MIDEKKRPLLGLHEKIVDHPIVLEKIPGLGTCPACAKLLELRLVSAGPLSSQCPYCHSSLSIIVPRRD